MNGNRLSGGISKILNIDGDKKFDHIQFRTLAKKIQLKW